MRICGVFCKLIVHRPSKVHLYEKRASQYPEIYHNSLCGGVEGVYTKKEQASTLKFITTRFVVAWKGSIWKKIYTRYRKREKSGSWQRIFCIGPFESLKSKLRLTFGIPHFQNFV